MQPKLEAQSPVTREIAEFDPRHPHERDGRNESPVFDKDGRCLVCCRDYADELSQRLKATQSPPLAAWEEKRVGEIVWRLIEESRSPMKTSEALMLTAKFTAELLASMPGGWVDGEVLEAAERLKKSAEAWIGECPDDEESGPFWRDQLSVCNAILSGRGADDAGWRPIETAPKDSSWILAVMRTKRQAVVRWSGGAWEDDNRLCRDPIFWQPLQKPPGIVASGKGADDAK